MKIKRLIAAYLDLMLCGLVAVIIHLIEVAIFGDDSSHSSFPVWGSMLFFLLKDSVWYGESIGKKIVGIKILRTQNEIEGRFLNFCRNLFYFIWPLEALLMILNSNGKRLGDLIFGGEFVETSPLVKLSELLPKFKPRSTRDNKVK